MSRIRLPAKRGVIGWLVACAMVAGMGSAATAQPVPVQPLRLAAADVEGPAWAELAPAQRTALSPLQREWNRLDPQHKLKWLELASRYPRMPEEERSRLQARMSDWARMSPQERIRARQQFQEMRKVSPADRQAKWQVYRALPEDQRRKLAGGAARKSDTVRSIDLVGVRSGGRKMNIVANPAYAAPPKPVAPTLVQARPGATTTLLSNPAEPPMHQQPGLRKIAAEPGFIDPETLLPRRGPQGAAARSPKASGRGAGAKP